MFTYSEEEIFEILEANRRIEQGQWSTHEEVFEGPSDLVDD